MTSQQIAALCWPLSKSGEGVTALARKASLLDEPVEGVSGADSIEWQAKRLGCEADAIETTFADLEARLSTAHPAILKFGEAGHLAIAGSNRRWLRVLTADMAVRQVPLQDVCDAIRAFVAQPTRPDYESLLKQTQLSPEKQTKVVDLLLAEQIGGRRFDGYWLLRVSPGVRPARWIRQAHTVRNLSGLVAAHFIQYLLFVASWAILGRLSFEGRLDRKWLIAWALLLLALIPFRVLTTWLQGLLVVGVGGILKRRLLAGALRLNPDEVRHQGVGSFLGQALEAEAVETLALSGGIAGLLAVMELIVSGFVLGRFALLLLVWAALTALFGWLFLRRYQQSTAKRMTVTQEQVESMVGHRTRLAQQRRDQWHETEDQALSSYFEASRAADTASTLLISLIPRGWLLVALSCLTPAIVAGAVSSAHVAIALGGILLAYNAFRRLTASFADVAGAWVAWQTIAPLFHAAARPEHLPQILSRPVLSQAETGSSPAVIEANNLSYSYGKHRNPALQGGNLTIRRGDRVLLQGSSGGGKSTFASLLAGLRKPDSGVLLLNGQNFLALGDDRWRKQVVISPQFHENHILTETLAFNVLMGRGWPPNPSDIEEAEALARELGLGDLLERMPGGIMQMVGEGGWQLSHGERSRIYVARSLLQNAGLVILDESFAALDPENLKGALECTLRHAETLMVIAHP